MRNQGWKVLQLRDSARSWSAPCCFKASISGIILYSTISCILWDYPVPSLVQIGNPFSAFVSTTAIYILLTLITSRIRENAFRWIYLIYFIYEFNNALIERVYDIVNLQNISHLLILLPYILFFRGFFYLFSKESTDWYIGNSNN